jgi:uncharacterized protein YgbK (DUF1537 family)
MGVLLGCVADDSTGATDLANTLVKQGMRTVQLIGMPGGTADDIDADAIVIALKSRTIAAAEAVVQSRAALAWLRAAGARQAFFKYCSTFDSTDQGNIGPVAEALLADLDAPITIACPAFPANGRTVYQGYLFVGDVLLSESSMRHHPLTPMLDSSLVRVLAAQSQGAVGLVSHQTVRQGAVAIRTALERLAADHYCAVVDALSDEDLFEIGEASSDLSLVTGGSGVALALPENFRHCGQLGRAAPAKLPPIAGHAAVLAGSCSAATQEQVQRMRSVAPGFALDPLRLAAGDDVVDEALSWARVRLADGPVLIYSTAPPDVVGRVQEQLGREKAGEFVEQAMAALARGLVKTGVRRLIVAGGETAGAVVGALGVKGLRIGPEIDPGVPWTMSLGEPVLALALKSGNFGGPDFFTAAFKKLS